MQRTFLLDVIVRQGPTIFQLFSGKNQPLLIRRNPFFVLNLGLNVLNRIRRLNLEGDRLSSKSFHKDLHFS